MNGIGLVQKPSKGGLVQTPWLAMGTDESERRPIETPGRRAKAQSAWEEVGRNPGQGFRGEP
jgi:hypothetical protein